MIPIEMDDLEEELSELDKYTNHEQLIILVRESQHMMIYGILPNEDWYQQRAPYLHAYSDLSWKAMSERFQNKDPYLHETAGAIADMLETLLEEWSSSPVFNLATYARVLYEMDRLWRYYHTQYVGDETDEDIVDVIEGLTHMMNSKTS
jgi:hypothetical protein